MPPKEKENVKTIKLRKTVALYINSVLCSGIIVLSGIVLRIARPTSIIVGIILSIASVHFALTFSNLLGTKPET